MISEGLIHIDSNNIFSKGPGKISNGFYNAEMVPSRDFTVSLLKYLGHGVALDGMAGTGVRGIRIAKEANWDVVINDKDFRNEKIIRRNVELNDTKAEIWSLDFGEAVSRGYWDYIDLDPYGSPVGYVEIALNHLKNHGVLGVTMTDTSVLEGKFLEKGYLKYGGYGCRGIYSKEISTRIFVGYIVRVASSLEMGSEVLLVIREKHYIRAFIRFQKGVKRAKDSLEMVKSIKIGGNNIGPLYTGKLYSTDLLKTISLDNANARSRSLFQNMKNEDLMFLFFTNTRGKEEIPIDKIIESLKDKGFKAGRTNFYEKGIKTDTPEEEFNKIVNSI